MILVLPLHSWPGASYSKKNPVIKRIMNRVRSGFRSDAENVTFDSKHSIKITEYPNSDRVIKFSPGQKIHYNTEDKKVSHKI